MLAPTAPSETDPTPQLHDVTVKTKKTYSCAKVMGVPPEEWGIERNARDIKTCGYCFHETPRRQGDLIGEGYSATVLATISPYSAVRTSESQARDTVDESSGAEGDEALNDANRILLITEHYIRMDYEGDGKPCLYRVTTAGDDNIIISREDEEDVIKVDEIPFAAMTPVIITHRVFGRSIADLVMDIQRIKTALLRGALDNLYLHNNPRVEVAEAYASDNTLDDLLVSRPGGIVRTKTPGGLQWQVVPDITASVYPALQYFDATREWRTGVSRQGQGTDPNQLQNQVATIANQMFNAAQARIKLIARIFAETGIRDLFMLLHGVIRKNGSQAETVRLRNKWVEVDPRDWQERNDMIINVGLGDGSKSEKLAGAQLLIGAQEKALAAGMISKKNLYNSAKELTKLLGYKDVDAYFTGPKPAMDPNQPQQPTDPNEEPIPPPPNPDMEKGKMDAELKQQELQNRAEIEKVQAQADIATQNTKTQGELELARQKFELEKELKLLDMAIKREQHQFDMQAKQQMYSVQMQQAQDKHVQGLVHSDQKAEQQADAARAKVDATE